MAADFAGPNEAYVLDVYEAYLDDPSSVAEEWREFFQTWPAPDGDGVSQTTVQAVGRDITPTDAGRVEILSGVKELAQTIRQFGHFAAQLDPLGSAPPGDPELSLEHHGLTESDLAALPASIVGGPVAQRTETALEAIEALRDIYCSTSGFEFDHVTQPEERRWLRDAVEVGWYRPPQDPIDEIWLLHRLTQVEAFEKFLHRTFPGRTRFSIEGLDMMVPMLDEVIGFAVACGIPRVFLGMAHRGRLNVLAHILHKPYEDILAEFHGAEPLPASAVSEASEQGYTGDVKYHVGGHRDVENGKERDVTIQMAPNPSHLEFVNPVIMGMARAAQTECDRPGKSLLHTSRAMPILIHGDAAFAGEGIAAESLNLSQLTGFWVGGTVHIIANNQLGFTTTPGAGRSTRYASDLAKGYKVPIVHVNADDPVACISAIRMASEYRRQFRKDVLIDLVGYRRWGHNEGDDPSFTQPVMYKTIENHPTVREQWVHQLVDTGRLTEEDAEEQFRKALQDVQEIWTWVREQDIKHTMPEKRPPRRHGPVETAVEKNRLVRLNRELYTLPTNFEAHSRITRILERWRQNLEPSGDGVVEWGHGESLAFASILADGTPIRLTGQDVERGTFSQRHLVLHDVETDRRHTPLQTLDSAKAAFEVYNSPLSEAGVLGFEYGYDVQAAGSLVIWEAQYGDFSNAAQVIIDEFVVSAQVKWNQHPSLVMLLPHGYEGQGPDHSTGRLERFLGQAAQNNLRVANCTTAAQYFHLLRRQAALLDSDPRPLIIMTPKSLLRHPQARSDVRDLTEGTFEPVIDDVEASGRRDQVRRLVFCSGKIYVDLVTSNYRSDAHDLAIVRVEQLYPYPRTEISDILDAYPNIEEVVWVQEEPRNMGAWQFISPRLQELLTGDRRLRYVGRPRWAAPAEGATDWHKPEQERIVKTTFGVESAEEAETVSDRVIATRRA